MRRDRSKPGLYEVLKQNPNAGDRSVEVQADRPLPPVSTGGKPFVTLRLSVPALVLALAVLSVVIVAAFLVGARVERSRAQARAPALPAFQGLPGDAAGARTPRGGVPVVGGDDTGADPTTFYSVRAVTLKKDQVVVALNLKKDLAEATGYDVTDSLVGGKLVLYVGRFSSRDDPNLAGLLEKIKGLRIGHTRFDSAYPVKLRDVD